MINNEAPYDSPSSYTPPRKIYNPGNLCMAMLERAYSDAGCVPQECQRIPDVKDALQRRNSLNKREIEPPALGTTQGTPRVSRPVLIQRRSGVRRELGMSDTRLLVEDPSWESLS